MPCAQTAGGSYGGHCVDRDKYEAALRAAEAERDVLAEKVAEIEPLPELVARYLSDEPRTKPAGKGGTQMSGVFKTILAPARRRTRR